MPERVDIFVSPQHQPDKPASPLSSSTDTPVAIDTQIRIVRNDVSASAKKPALDHLRPRYVVQRAAPPLKPQSQVLRQSQQNTAPLVQPVTSPKPVTQPIVHPQVKGVPKVTLKAQPRAERLQSSPQIRSEAKTAERASQPKRYRWRKAMLLLLAGPIMLAAGLMLQTAAAGELLVAAYAVFALLRRVESRTTFTLALVSLGCIVAMLLVKPDPTLMKNFAIYAFLLMGVGTMSLVAETRYR